MVDPQAKLRTGLDQFMGVIALGAADDHHHGGLFCQFDGGMLPLFGRLADGVDETHFRLGKAFPDLLGEVADFFNRLGGLRGDAETRAGAEIFHIVVRQHEIEFFQVFRQTAHFHMAALANDDGMKPIRISNSVRRSQIQRASRSRHFWSHSQIVRACDAVIRDPARAASPA